MYLKKFKKTLAVVLTATTMLSMSALPALADTEQDAVKVTHDFSDSSITIVNWLDKDGKTVVTPSATVVPSYATITLTCTLAGKDASHPASTDYYKVPATNDDGSVKKDENDKVVFNQEFTATVTPEYTEGVSCGKDGKAGKVTYAVSYTLPDNSFYIPDGKDWDAAEPVEDDPFTVTDKSTTFTIAKPGHTYTIGQSYSVTWDHTKIGSATGFATLVKTCDVCGEQEKTDITANVEVVNPVCTSTTGYWKVVVTEQNVDKGTPKTGTTNTKKVTFKSSDAGVTFESGEAKEHTPGPVQIDPNPKTKVAPTCSTDGSYDEIVKCTVCGEVISRETKVDPKTNVHSPKHETKVISEATCTEQGEVRDYYVCAVCHQVLSEKVIYSPALGHDTVAVAKADATCEEDGHEAGFKCKRCGGLFADAAGNNPIKSIPAKGHELDWAAVAGKNVCGGTGYTVYCVRYGTGEGQCDYSEVFTGHEYEEEDFVDASHPASTKKHGPTPSDNKDGVKWVQNVCKACGAVEANSLRQVADPVEHTKTITVDGKTREVSAIEIDKVTFGDTFATGKDFTVTYKCSVCGEAMESTDETVFPTSGVGIWNNAGQVYETQLYKDGKAVKDNTKTRYTSKQFKNVPHEKDQLIRTEGKAPTCTEDGYHYEAYSCKYCDKNLDAAGNPLKAGSNGTVIVDKATGHVLVGFDGDGVKCMICGEVFVKPSGEVVPVTYNFEDVNESDYYYEAIYAMAYEDVMTGMEGNQYFAPKKPITRAEFVCALWRLAGSPKVLGAKSFPDVKTTDWFYEAVAWATSQGIVSGYTNGKFGSYDLIQREQIAQMLYMYETGGKFIPTTTLTFKDSSKISSWAVNAVKWAVGAGVIHGYQNGNFGPQDNAIRGDVAILLYNVSRLN